MNQYQRRADQDTDGTIDDIDGAAYWQRRDIELAQTAPALTEAKRRQRRIALLRADQGIRLANPGELDALEAANRADAAEARDSLSAEWTLAVTTERRAAYNAAVTSGRFTGPTGIVLEGKLDAALGFSRDDLIAAVTRHGL